MTGLTEYIRSVPGGWEKQVMSEGNNIPEHIRRKLLLLRALSGSPKLLLLWNPFQGMKLEEINRIWKFLEEELPETTVLVAGYEAQWPDTVTATFRLDSSGIIPLKGGAGNV